jgi:hypothetical protein
VTQLCDERPEIGRISAMWKTPSGSVLRFRCFVLSCFRQKAVASKPASEMSIVIPAQAGIKYQCSQELQGFPPARE